MATRPGRRQVRAPEPIAAIAAARAHGLSAPEALKSSFGQWLTVHAEAVEAYGLAHFYAGKNAPRAFVNYTRLTQFLCVLLVDQSRRIARLERRPHTPRQLSR